MNVVDPGFELLEVDGATAICVHQLEECVEHRPGVGLGISRHPRRHVLRGLKTFRRCQDDLRVRWWRLVTHHVVLSVNDAESQAMTAQSTANLRTM